MTCTTATAEPAQVPLSTDSMITVRLSEVHFDTKVPMASAVEEEEESEDMPTNSVPSTCRSSGSSRRSSNSSATNSVNWEGLEKTEEQEPRDERSDDSTALLLARLEHENNALAHDPKSGMVIGRSRNDARPMSIHHLKKLVDGPQRQSLRYSLLPAPAMTELEFWAALVKDYPQTCQRLPTLTSNKIRGGVPPPLRGVVWPAIAGAHDAHLHSEFQRLAHEVSPYDGLIGKDVGRSFPNVDMFKEKDGEGQRMLGKVLKAFSLYDDKIGYCQGLGFVVGPLLMHMSEPEAFCVLVRLMEHYDIRSCYTPDLGGLHLRIYQFQTLLTRHLPDLSKHLSDLKIEPLYVSQWFLSFFAVTCPLPMLLRIYDVILSEGATETLMRVALSLMSRNEKKLMAFTEFEDAMQFLLSRSLWDTYAQHADDMVADFVSLTGLVSRESLQSLESDFQQTQVVTAPPSTLKSAASSLLGRFWAGASHTYNKSTNLSLSIPKDTTAVILRKTASGNSLTSTSNSTDSTTSEVSTVLTDLSEGQRVKSESLSVTSTEAQSQTMVNAVDRDLHQQIEELLTALSKLQHQQIEISRDLQREREERAEERQLASALLRQLRSQREAVREMVGFDEPSQDEVEVDELVDKASTQFADESSKRQSMLLSKRQLRDDANAWRGKHEEEAAKCRDLMARMDERESEYNDLKENLKDARARIQDCMRDKQRLERVVQDLRTRSPSTPSDSPSDMYSPVSELGELKLPAAKGLREFRLGRPESQRTPSSSGFSKRTSSLNMQSILATESHQPASSDTLLVELVNAKTAEAVARQELEETKNKLESLRKIISGPVHTPKMQNATLADSGSSTGSITPPAKSEAKAVEEPPKTTSHAPSSSIGGFFSGWGKRST